MKNLKEWTLLLYANGNNELEPETWQTVMSIQNSPSCMNTNVVVQISREKQDNVSILRADKSDAPHSNIWSGVRRYAFNAKGIVSISNLTNVNMADPTALYDFIDWGITNFPAKRYILSISGHIYQFVGMCPDYSGAMPLMMGFPEISICIQEVLKLHDAILDILILDTCYASTVEILYEMGKYKHSRIKQVLTYIGKGPLEGLPYPNLLSLLERIAHLPTNHILENFVDKIAINHQIYGLIALTINHDILELVQQLFSKMASSYLYFKDAIGVNLTPEELLSNYREDYPWSLYLKPIHKLLKGMIIAAHFADNGSNAILPIHILYQKIPDEQRITLYGRLAFAKQNAWTTLLCDCSFELQLTPSITEIFAIPINKNILTSFIYASNEHMPLDKIENITNTLIQKKSWVLK